METGSPTDFSVISTLFRGLEDICIEKATWKEPTTVRWKFFIPLGFCRRERSQQIGKLLLKFYALIMTPPANWGGGWYGCRLCTNLHIYNTYEI